jgi:6-pyruvoyltetrahydropterin/6-carboxytetrahydropterin synthase
MKPHFRRQRIRVVKKFTIEMAHALDGYDGPCRNIHGHTYHLKVTVSGKPCDDQQNSKLGMVIDFGNLKKIVQENIIAVYDHALVLNERSAMIQETTLTDHFGKLIIVPWQPTCENLVVDFRNRIHPHLPEEIQLESLILDETPTSSAEWWHADNL